MRWVIIVIIFVFDPLAVLLLIAANFTFKIRYGKSFEEMIGVPEPKNDGGVTPDTYWQERFADMQDQLNRFNDLKEQQDDLPSTSYEVDIKQDKDLFSDLNVSFNETLDLKMSEDKIEEFKKREEAEKKALEEYARKYQDETSNDAEEPTDSKEQSNNTSEPDLKKKT